MQRGLIHDGHYAVIAVPKWEEARAVTIRAVGPTADSACLLCPDWLATEKHHISRFVPHPRAGIRGLRACDDSAGAVCWRTGVTEHQAAFARPLRRRLRLRRLAPRLTVGARFLDRVQVAGHLDALRGVQPEQLAARLRDPNDRVRYLRAVGLGPVQRLEQRALQAIERLNLKVAQLRRVFQDLTAQLIERSPDVAVRPAQPAAERLGNLPVAHARLAQLKRFPGFLRRF